MTRYIDADALLSRLPDDIPYKASVKRVLMQAPEADVVPKSEADNWYQLYHSIKEELKQEKMYHRETEKLCDRYCIESQQAKKQVVKEIFEEIDVLVNDWKNNYIQSIQFMAELSELKKKYAEVKDDQLP